MRRLETVENPSFETVNRAYNSVFTPGRLSLGLVAPLESYAIGSIPS
ncbi:MAG: LLM class flavin-dependent oxidoreductase, partial [Proteobacteria bacterium]